MSNTCPDETCEGDPCLGDTCLDETCLGDSSSSHAWVTHGRVIYIRAPFFPESVKKYFDTVHKLSISDIRVALMSVTTGNTC